MRIVFEKTSVSGVGSLKAWLSSWELPLASQGHANRDSLAKTGAASPSPWRIRKLDRQTLVAVSASERRNMNEHAKSRSGLQSIIGGS